MSSLGEELPLQLERNRELLQVYKDIGPNGMFGATMIQMDITAGEKALASGDVIEMIRVFERLKNNE